MAYPRPAASHISALVVDGDPQVRHLLQQQLTRAGYRVDAAASGGEALRRAASAAFDIILLELDLAEVDGLTVCRAIRASGANRATPIVLLSNRASEADTVLGLDSGADDYVVKPFGVREVLARVAAIVRRRLWVRPLAERPGLVLDRLRRRLTLDGRLIPTTRQEFDLMDYLAARPGALVTRATLLQNVWHGDGQVTERTVDAVVCRLRRKIERDPHSPRRLVTAWGVGYTLRDPGATAPAPPSSAAPTPRYAAS